MSSRDGERRIRFRADGNAEITGFLELGTVERRVCGEQTTKF